MKQHPSIAVIDFADIPTGVWATDAMIKKAPIALLRCGTITHARYLTIIGGTPASVAESLHEVLVWGAEHVLDHVFLADVHERLFEAIGGARHAEGSGAMVVIVTDTVAAIVRAVEAALKGTPVTLVEIRLADSGLAGRGLAVLRGELPDIEAATGLALAGVGPGRAVTHRIVTSPHEALLAQIDAESHFSSAEPLELEGGES